MGCGSSVPTRNAVRVSQPLAYDEYALAEEALRQLRLRAMTFDSRTSLSNLALLHHSSSSDASINLAAGPGGTAAFQRKLGPSASLLHSPSDVVLCGRSGEQCTAVPRQASGVSNASWNPGDPEAEAMEEDLVLHPSASESSVMDGFCRSDYGHGVEQQPGANADDDGGGGGGDTARHGDGDDDDGDDDNGNDQDVSVNDDEHQVRHHRNRASDSIERAKGVHVAGSRKSPRRSKPDDICNGAEPGWVPGQRTDPLQDNNAMAQEMQRTATCRSELTCTSEMSLESTPHLRPGWRPVSRARSTMLRASASRVFGGGSSSSVTSYPFQSVSSVSVASDADAAPARVADAAAASMARQPSQQSVSSWRSRPNSDRELCQLFDTSCNALVVMNLACALHMVSPSVEEILQRPAGSLYGISLLQLTHPEDVQRVRQQLCRSDDGDIGIDGSDDARAQSRAFESRVIAGDGSTRWMMWHARVNRQADRIYAVGTDITESKIAELINERIMSLARDGLFLVAADGIVTGCNASGARMVEAESTDMLIGRGFPSLFQDPMLVDLAALSRQRSRRLNIVAQSGRVIPVEVSVAETTIDVVDDKQRVIKSYVASVHDDSERVLAMQMLVLEKARSEALLENMLPHSVITRLKVSSEQGRDVTYAQRFDSATVCFIDIAGFTKWSSRTAPETVASELNRVFSLLDSLTERHGCEKIKTIGDSFMVAGGVPVATRQHASCVAQFALDAVALLHSTEHAIRDADELLQCRVGIASGPLVAGVLGLKKLTYDLWGDTVNLASRMESTGVPGRVQMTRGTKDLLASEGCFLTERRGMVSVKGKGDVEAFFLNGYLPGKRPPGLARARGLFASASTGTLASFSSHGSGGSRSGDHGLRGNRSDSNASVSARRRSTAGERPSSVFAPLVA